MNILSFIQSKHNLIFKLVIVFVCSVCIVALLPGKQVKGLRVGSFDAIWAGPDLIAEEDLFLKKSQAEIDIEKKEIENSAPLFFENREEEKDKKMNELDLLKQNNLKAYLILKPIFDSIYQRGVIESIDKAQQGKQIFLANGNFAEAGIYFDFFTIKTAADHIESELNNIKKSEMGGINYLNILSIT